MAIETVFGVDIDNIAIWVKSNMNAGGLSVRVAAKEIGISPTTLQRIVNGNIPDIKTLEKVMEWLGCRLAFYSID
jgi:transcriptional regulator with XRE-family HTH domain